VVEARTTTYQVDPDFAARQSILWSIAWLVGGVTITLLSDLITLHPSVVHGYAFLQPGRLIAVANNAIVFGWLATIGFAAVFALLPRIAEVQLHNEPLGAATTLTWSVILAAGLIALFAGVDQGRPFGELPAGADLGLALMLVFVLYNAGVTAARRRERTLYVSGWFLLAAALLAPLVYVLGNLPLFKGVLDAIVNGFYVNGIEMLWMLPIGLGIAYYVVPVESGAPLASAALARASFWSLMFAGGWAGERFYLKGPAPSYLDTIAVAMTFVLVLPVLSAATNLFATARDRWDLATRSYGLRFAATGLALAVAWIALESFSAIPSVSRFVGLTAWGEGVRHLAIFGVFSSFGSALIYHAYPLMVGREWYSRGAAAFHFWGTQLGVLTGTVALLAAGAAQSAALSVGKGTTPLPAANVVGMLRVVAVLAFVLVAAAQYALAYNAIRTSRSGSYVDLVARHAAVARAGV
jgi:cytochrome c oxidase cbb3-type subunit 1